MISDAPFYPSAPTAWPAPDPWVVYRWWVLAAIAVSLVLLVPNALVASVDFTERNGFGYQLVSLLLIVASILLPAVAQGLIIGRALPIPWWAWAAVTAVTALIVAALRWGGSTALTTLARDESPITLGMLFLGLSCGAAILGGLLVGVAQAWLLHPHTRPAALWVAATTGIYVLNALASSLGVQGVIQVVDALRFDVPVAPLVGLASTGVGFIEAIMSAILSGFALVYLLRHRRAPDSAARVGDLSTNFETNSTN